jgi:hypothetical protein
VVTQKFTPLCERSPKPKDDPPGTPGWQQALRAWPRAAHDERHLLGVIKR